MSDQKQKKSSNSEFKGIKALLWPIHNYEIKKFVPMALIMCAILFNYTVCRNTKDTLIISSSGAGTITFLKLYVVTPAAVLFLILYAKISNIFNKETIFYALVIPFLVFFAIFAFVLNPLADTLHPSAETIANLHSSYPAAKGFINIYAYWIYSLFYLMSELWGTVVLSLGFWQFANEITKISEAKRFYGLFVVISNIALIFCGKAVSFASVGIKKFLPANTSDASAWTVSLYVLMSMLIIVGILAMLLYRWMYKNVLSDPKYYDGPKEKKKKKKPGLVESLKIIFSSKELGLIAMLVISYGITINLVEVQWKNQITTHFNGNKALINKFMGDFSAITGIVTIMFALFIGSNILRKFGWFMGALFTPVVLVVLGALFFFLVIGGDSSLNALAGIFSGLKGKSPAYLATMVGAAIVIVSKAAKYSLFDPTKEMAYIPLDDELKTKGKAAVDVIGGRLGKSGGAFIQSTLMMLLNTAVIGIINWSTIIFIVVCIAWMYAVKGLSNKVKESSNK